MVALEKTGSRRGSAVPLKQRLLLEGARVEDTILPAEAKRRHRVRSGACGGLDLVLESGEWVNCPVDEPFAQDSPLELRRVNGGLGVFEAGEYLGVAAPVTEPAYYQESTAAGMPLVRLAQVCSDRVGVGLTNLCAYWGSAALRCRFCSIGMNVTQEERRKPVAEVVEAVLASLSDPVNPSRHILLGGGTPNFEDAGAAAIAEASALLREHTQAPIYAMLAPSTDLDWIDRLAAAGVDEIGLNIEFFSNEFGRRFTPGKWAKIGREKHLAALERAVAVFGPIATRSITVVGLEPFEVTVAGVADLAERGVMPILSPFRPLAGTRMASHPRWPAARLWDLTKACAEAADAHGVPLGPTCIPCQANTLTVPGHPLYRHY